MEPGLTIRVDFSLALQPTSAEHLQPGVTFALNVAGSELLCLRGQLRGEGVSIVLRAGGAVKWPHEVMKIYNDREIDVTRPHLVDSKIVILGKDLGFTFPVNRLPRNGDVLVSRDELYLYLEHYGGLAFRFSTGEIENAPTPRDAYGEWSLFVIRQDTYVRSVCWPANSTVFD